MKTLSVVCPVYNEEQVIGEFHTRLRTVLDTLADRYEAEILYVVDRGTDRTLPILKEIARTDARVKILAMSARFGHQMALLAGIDHSRGDAVVMLDSDLQHPPELIPAMLEAWNAGHDIVFTVRRDAATTGFFKRLTSRAFYRVINAMAQIPIQESAADFRLVSRRVAELFRTEIRERNQFLRGLFAWVGFSRTGISFDAEPRRKGRSKYTVTRLLAFASGGVVSFSKRPLHAAIFVGTGFALFGLALALVTFVQYLHYAHLPSGWTTIVILISGFNGIQLIFLGILGQYLGAIFDEVKARPHYIVEERVNFDA